MSKLHHAKLFDYLVGMACGLILALGLVGSGCANDTGREKHAAVFQKIAPEDIATVGMDVCANCHAGQTTAWLTSAHGNLEAIDHTTHAPLNLGLDSDGFPYYAYFTNATCAACHDPLGDGQRLSPGWTGNVPRPVVGCESCHGGGAEHYGLGPIAFPSPDYGRCGQCHNSKFPAGHLPYHPNGDNILEEYLASGHFRSVNEHTLATALTTVPATVRAKCSRCHTDEGFRQYISAVPATMGHDEIGDRLDDEPNLENASPVQCRTCHEPHTVDADDLTRLKASTLNGDTQSGEFNQCTACHQLINRNGTVITDAYHDPAVNQYGSNSEIIADSHAAVPGDTRLNTGAGAQFLYFVKKGADNACAACHNPHLGSAEINRQYRRSGHGDALGDPWTHYDWKHSVRAACQRCHTSTGFKNFADSLINATVYNPAANDFSYLLGNDDPNPRVDTNDQLETLYCWACHTDYKGGLRNPGAFNITAIEPTYVRMDNSAITFPDVSGSNICLLCHTGRVSGGTIYNSTGNFSNLAFQNSHYLTAGGIVFGEIGYEYPGRNYANVPYFEHDEIGLTEATEAAGTNGPCVGCHMHATREKHLFLPIARDGETITAITSTACAACHTGQYELTPAELTEEEEQFHAAMEALKYQLQLISRADGGTGYFWANCHPYFFKTQADADACASANAVRNWCTAGDANCTVAALTTGKPNMGAAYNFNLLEHDPGAFVHNRYYTKRLLYDSIDWIDNTALDGSVYATLNALNPVTHPYKARAMEYLLSATNGRP